MSSEFEEHLSNERNAEIIGRLYIQRSKERKNGSRWLVFANPHLDMTLHSSVSWTCLFFWQWAVRGTPKSVADDY